MYYNRSIRKYVKIMLRTTKPNIAILYLKKYKSKKFSKYAVSYLKEIAIDYTICPFCNNRYDEEHKITDIGLEFTDDGIYVCCHNCALEAGLVIC